jgi:hypothetical protein
MVLIVLEETEVGNEVCGTHCTNYLTFVSHLPFGDILRLCQYLDYIDGIYTRGWATTVR